MNRHEYTDQNESTKGCFHPGVLLTHQNSIRPDQDGRPFRLKLILPSNIAPNTNNYDHFGGLIPIPHRSNQVVVSEMTTIPATTSEVGASEAMFAKWGSFDASIIVWAAFTDNLRTSEWRMMISKLIDDIPNLKSFFEDAAPISPSPETVAEARCFLNRLLPLTPLPEAKYYFDGGLSFFWDTDQVVSGFSLFGNGSIECYLKHNNHVLFDDIYDLDDEPQIKAICQKIFDLAREGR
ncbi:MAG: hypothetical protein LBS31_11120 [Candidatus Adiutrix sp.]|jgi:hypothetical protein|nr:hypothetical protein [Candidatus Adiutrix sp.]